MTGDGTERYLLSRRGLPLPLASARTLPGHWLPPAARQQAWRIESTAVAVVPEPVDDVPDELVDSRDAEHPGASATRMARDDDATPIVAPRHSTVSPAERVALPRDRHDEVRVPAAAPPSAPPLRTSDTPAFAPAIHDRPTVETTADLVPRHPHVPSPSTPVRARPAANEGNAPPGNSSGRQTRAGETRVSAPIVVELKGQHPVQLPSALEEDRSRELPLPLPPLEHALRVRDDTATSADVHALPSQRREIAEPVIVTRPSALGHASQDVEPLGPGPAIDLTPLLTPASPETPAIHIDRMTVTVQPPPATNLRPTNVAPPAATARPATAPAPRTFRSPWASYFARRD